MVVVIVRLDRKAERTRQGDLDATIGVGLQELQVTDLNGQPAPNRADHTWHQRCTSRWSADLGGVVQVQAIERCREAVRIALAAYLAIGDDVDAGQFHAANRQQGCVVLRPGEVRLWNAPHLCHSHTRYPALGQLRTIDQPVGLRVTADDGGREEPGCRNAHHDSLMDGRSCAGSPRPVEVLVYVLTHLSGLRPHNRRGSTR